MNPEYIVLFIAAKEITDMAFSWCFSQAIKPLEGDAPLLKLYSWQIIVGKGLIVLKGDALSDKVTE